MSARHHRPATPSPSDRPLHAALANPRRLALIRRLDLQGHLGDPDLDGIVAALAEGCRVPAAVVNVVTPDRQTYAAEVGVGGPETDVPDELSFCAEVVRTGQPLVVADAGVHPVYSRNPLVSQGTLGSYAGQPLRVGGEVLGVMSMLDAHPRVFSGRELAVLQAQARLAEAVLRLRAAAACDPLTGLDTRTRLLGRVTDELERSGRSGQPVGLLVLEVIGLGRVNERYGSAAGDLVLRELADRVTTAAEGQDAGRLGGATLAVLCRGITPAGDVAAAVTAATGRPLHVAGVQVDVVVRPGLAVGTSGTADALLAAARRAVVAATAAGGAGSVLSDVAALRAALANDQLVLHYQPVVELDSGRTAGVEALVRWQHPDGRLVPPLDFIPLAEESGLIVDLGEWVLRTAGAQAARWAAAGTAVDVAINLSPLQVARPRFAQDVLRVLAGVGAPLANVVLEVTESALLDDRAATTALWALRGEGLRLALDDFGTGYASLAYLRRFPIDIIKVDQSFVAGLGRHPDDDAIVNSVVSLAHRTGKTVVAEGVETRGQAQVLHALGVSLAQGFFWAAPLPAEQVAERLTPPPPAAPVDGPALAVGADEEVADTRIQRMHAAGASSHTIAAALNSTGLRTSRGVRWHVSSVARVLAGPVRDRALA